MNFATLLRKNAVNDVKNQQMPRYKHPKVIETKLGRRQADGVMEWAENTIYIEERLRGKAKLDAYIHEYLHHLYPDMPEDKVNTSASKLADFLYKHHFRLVDNV